MRYALMFLLSMSACTASPKYKVGESVFVPLNADPVVGGCTGVITSIDPLGKCPTCPKDRGSFGYMLYFKTCKYKDDKFVTFGEISVIVDEKTIDDLKAAPSDS